MYQHPYLQVAIKAEQQRDWQRAAAHRQVLKRLLRERPSGWRRVARRLSARLAALGSRLAQLRARMCPNGQLSVVSRR
jgi:hypothetical protein